MSNEGINSDKKRVILYTDEPQLSYGVSALLATVPAFDLFMTCQEVCDLAPAAKATLPDVILLDLTPEITIGLLGALHLAAPAARLILWGRTCSEELRAQGRAHGVAGFLHRRLSNEEFLAGLETLARGGKLFDGPPPARSTTVELTPRESQLVTLLVQGLRNKEIGSCLGITEGTVRVYLSKLFIKTGARDRLELAVFGLKNALCGQSSWDGRGAFVTENDETRAKPMLRSLLLVEPTRRTGYAAAFHGVSQQAC